METQFSTHLVSIVLLNPVYGRILGQITPWTSFPNDIHQAILSATTHAHLLPIPFDINGWTWDTIVENEPRIHFHGTVALHEPAEGVLRRLGVNGRFAMSGGGNSAIVGNPDFSWVSPHPESYRMCISPYLCTC
jgi:hypothetical protein